VAVQLVVGEVVDHLAHRGHPVLPQGEHLVQGRAYVAAHPDVRLIDGRFMQIRQAVGTTKARRPETVEFLRNLVEELKANGFVAESLRRSNQPDATVAPPA